VINPSLAITLAGGDGTARLIAAAAYDILALSLATGLSVFKPGAPFR
jgi:predicted polyphosphate/ATP-dependent NAD kinase